MKRKTHLIVSSIKNRIASLNLSRSIITWGIFDGVHRGHQKIVRCVVNWARRVKGTSIVLTFREHPQKILGRKSPLFITSLQHRLLFLKRLGVDLVMVTPFTKRLASLSPEDFIEQTLIKRLRVYGIVASKKTRFGKGQQGDINLLKKLCRYYGIYLKIINTVRYKNKFISSTYIREAIRQGNIKEAEQMLGRRVTLLGRVVRGAGRGRKIGIPTANLNLHHELTPPRGVYASRVNLAGSSLKGLTNIGIRPTFASTHRVGHRGQKEVVEVHLLGLNPNRYRNLYGKDIELEIITKLRNEKRWAKPEQLVRQIERDKQYFLDPVKDK